MRRVTTKSRVDWRPGLRKYPFGVRAMGAGAGWREDVRYEFTVAQIDLIESVADELHGLILQATRSVIERKAFGSLAIPSGPARLIEASWNDYWAGGRGNERAGGLVGRLTLAYDGRDAIKLLACNYDTCDGLFTASIIQRNWLEAMCGDADQFNGLHSGLIERWEELSAGSGREHIHLTCYTPDSRREGELVYLSATAADAGIASDLLPIQAIGWDGRRFRDAEGGPIAWLGKIYPWEAMIDDAFGQHLRSGGLSVLEPLWRWVPSLHGFLAFLWYFYPQHPNLCRAALEKSDLSSSDAVTIRSNFGLDHAAVRMIEHGKIIGDTNVDDIPGGFLCLETPTTFVEEDMHAVIDAWIVGDKCLGMTVRESKDARVGPESATVPHLFRP